MAESLPNGNADPGAVGLALVSMQILLIEKDVLAAEFLITRTWQGG
jgi:hypothetical protein